MKTTPDLVILIKVSSNGCFTSEWISRPFCQETARRPNNQDTLSTLATLIETQPAYTDVPGANHYLAVEPFLPGTIGNCRACYLRTGFKDEPDSFDGCLLAPDIVQI